MRGVIIYPTEIIEKSRNAFQWFVDEANSLDIELEVLVTENFKLLSHKENCILYDGKLLEKIDFAIIRDYNVLLSSHLENMGIRVINSTLSMEVSKNKMLTHQLLSRNGINTPRTIFDITQSYRYDELVSFFGCKEIVLKGIEGAKGESVYLVNSQYDIDRVMKECKKDILAQEFIESSKGRDLRVWVIGNRVVGCVLRSSKSDFRSNYSLGGTVELIEIDKEIEEVAVNSVKAIGLEFAGVDLMFLDKGGYTVCEVNGNAGFRSLFTVSDINIPYELLKYIKKGAKN